MVTGTANQSSLFMVSDFFEPSKGNDRAGRVGKGMELLGGSLIGLIMGLLALVIVVIAVIAFRILKNPGDNVEEASNGQVDGFNESMFDPSRSLYDLQYE
jgi:hypothetical protein